MIKVMSNVMNKVMIKLMMAEKIIKVMNKITDKVMFKLVKIKLAKIAMSKIMIKLVMNEKVIKMMKKRMIKIENSAITMPFLLLVLLMFFSVGSIPLQAMAESENVDAGSRSIYVGDIIEIKIVTEEISRDEIEEKFKDFEIVSIKEQKDGYIIALRTFETGEKRILLGDKEIVIDVKSTLDEIQRDDVFEGSLDPEEAGFSIEWRYIFYFLLTVMLVSGCISLREYLAKRKIRTMTPFERFIRLVNSISPDDDMFFVKLTAGFKEYVEATYSCSIRGKTSIELINTICSFPVLCESLPAIKSWLMECDRLKFSGVKVSKEKKHDFCSELVELVRWIDERISEIMQEDDERRKKKSKNLKQVKEGVSIRGSTIEGKENKEDKDTRKEKGAAS